MSFLQRVRVPAGFAFAAFFVLMARPFPEVLWPGLVLAAAGLMIRIWASGHLRRGGQLAVAGPYAHTRNPLYFGSFLMGLGFSLASGQVIVLALFLFLFFVIYGKVMRREEEELARMFGAAYARYRKQVPSFIPRLRNAAAETDKASNFQWRQVIFNREYNNAAGFILLTAFLLLRMLWL